MFNAHWSLIFFTMLFCQSRHISGASTPVNLNMDLAIVIDGVQKWKSPLDKIRNVLSQELPKLLQISPSKTRVALVATLGQSWHVFSHLTGDFEEFKLRLEAVPTTPPRSDIGFAFRFLRYQVFKIEEMPTRPRVILMLSIVIESQAVSPRAWNESQVLRDNGVVFFVYFEHENPDQYFEEFRLLVNDMHSVERVPERMEHFAESRLASFVPRVTERLCATNESCFYADNRRNKCEKMPYTPLNPSGGGDCGAAGYAPAPLSSESCQRSECQKTCDKLWPRPMDQSDCEQTCGAKVTLSNDPPWPQLQFCQTYFKCPPCTTTTTASTMKTKTPKTQVSLSLLLGIVIPAAIIVLAAVCGLGGFMIWRMRKRNQQLRMALKGISSKGVVSKKAGMASKKTTKSKTKTKSKSKSKAGSPINKSKASKKQKK